MKPLTPRQFEAVLRRHGWRLNHTKGSHRQWRGPDGRFTIVAAHGNSPLKQGTQLAMIRQTGIPRSEFENA